MVYAMEQQQQQQAAPMALPNKQEPTKSKQQRKLRLAEKLIFRAICDIIRVENKKRPQKKSKNDSFLSVFRRKGEKTYGVYVQF